jgi:hypothetical protein
MDHRDKLVWAEEHLIALDQEMDAFAEKNPFTARAEIDRQARRIRVFADEHLAVPDRWSLIVGDIVHNTRSALDHLIWALSSRGPVRPTTEGAKRIQFPISTKRDDYLGVETPKPRHGQRERCISFLEPGARAIVDGLQPYLDGKRAHDHLLAVLDRLSSEEKRRKLPVAAIIRGAPQISFSGLGAPVTELASITYQKRRLEQDAALMVLDFHGPIPVAKLRVDPRLAIDLAFDEEGPGAGAPVATTLQRLHECIRKKVFKPLEVFL